MCCTLGGVVSFGIFLAVLDMFHGVATLGFYTYMFILQTYSQCPADLKFGVCAYTMYIYDQMFKLRVYIAFGEGVAGLIFPLFYILALVKRVPCLTWLWIIKALAVISINIYYLSYWPIMQEQYIQINYVKSDYEDEIIYTCQGLTLVEIVLLVLFCFVGAIFSCKVCKKRSASKRRLVHRRKWEPNDASAPPFDPYDEEGLDNKGLANGEKALPLRASRGSLSDLNEAGPFKHSSGV